MSANTGQSAQIHQGRNLKRFREMMGIKQEILAFQLGEEWNQKRISILETKETIDGHLLQEISTVLNIPAEAIQNFDEATAMRHIRESYAPPVVTEQSRTPNFNPMDKLLETLEALVQLHTENKLLYERLLALEQEKLAMMKK